MRISRGLAALAALFALAACASTAAAPQPKTMTIYEAFGIQEPGLRGAALDRAVRAAAAFPLGSEQNPVRAQGPAGQREYLGRLRCADGRAPLIRGRMAGAIGPFGGIMDEYGVACPGSTPATAVIRLDMYHAHVETSPVPGFTITPR